MSDFSDKFSPMLVKELRQGMRTNLFAIAFVLLQGFMVICVLMGASDPQGASQVVSGFFWFFMGATLFFIMPMRGFSALSSEIKLETLDLIQLTRLGALRIVLGKWAALVAQTSLFVASVLPYIVMRYFFGGVNILTELGLILAAYLASCVLTAFMVGFSAFNSVILRTLMFVAVMFFGGFLLAGTFELNRAGYIGTPDPFQFWMTVAASVVTALFAIYYFLDLGASRIAPESSNHATRKRLVCLLYVLVMLGFSFLGASKEFCIAFSFFATAFVLIDAMTEGPTMVPSVYRPFASNPISRLGAYFFAPGWHTAIGFTLLMAGVIAGFVYVYGGEIKWSEKGFRQVIAALFGSLIVPVLIIQLFFHPATFGKFHFGLYLLVQVCMIALAIFVNAVGEAGSLGSILFMCVPIPQVCVAAAENNQGDDIYFLIASLVFIGLTLLVWLVRAFPLYRRVAEMMSLLKRGAASEELPTERLTTTN